jgi:hypothetical protein
MTVESVMGAASMETASTPPTNGQIWDLMDYLALINSKYGCDKADLRREYAEALEEAGFRLMAHYHRLKAEEVETRLACDAGPWGEVTRQMAAMRDDPCYQEEVAYFQDLI